MDKLIKVLPAILEASGGAPEVTEAACIVAWKQVCGHGLSRHAIPVRLQNNTLVVAVADAIWQKQLEQLRGQFLFRINALLGKPLLKSIELSILPDRFKRRPNDTETRLQRQDGHPAVPIELISAAASIQDATLRRAFLGAAVSCVDRVESNRATVALDNE